MASGALKSLNGINKTRENRIDQPKKKVLQKVEPRSSAHKQSNKNNRTIFSSKKNDIINPPEERKDSINAFLKGSLGSRKNTKKVIIFDESLQQSEKCKSVSSRTGNEDAKALMCSEAPTEKYWELLAEERRKALFAALEENKQLANEIESKNELIENMKIEIEQLEEAASHAHYLQSVLEKLIANNEKAADDAGISGLAHHPSDGNNQHPEQRGDVSDSSCSHDSDKENKPPLEFLPLCDSSDE